MVTGIEADFSNLDSMYFKKLARRRHDDICVISCACNFKVEGKKILGAKVCFGRMDEITVHLKPIEAYFNNLTIKDNVQEHLDEIAKVVADNYTFSTLTVRNDPDYRTSLVQTLV